MIEEPGTVVAEKGELVWVQTVRQSACESCSARAGCGQRVLSQMSGGRANRVLVANELGVRVGDQVIIGIGEQALMKASLLVYLLPLLFLVAAAVISDQWGPAGDGWSILAGAVGLALGFVVVGVVQYRHRHDPSLQPRLLRKVTAPEMASPARQL